MAETFTEAKFAQMVRELGPQRAIAEAAEKYPDRVPEILSWMSGTTTALATGRAVVGAKQVVSRTREMRGITEQVLANQAAAEAAAAEAKRAHGLATANLKRASEAAGGYDAKLATLTKKRSLAEKAAIAAEKEAARMKKVLLKSPLTKGKALTQLDQKVKGLAAVAAKKRALASAADDAVAVLQKAGSKLAPRVAAATATAAKTEAALAALAGGAKAAAPVAGAVAPAGKAAKALAYAKGLPTGRLATGLRVANAAGVADAVSGILGNTYTAAAGKNKEVPDDFMTWEDFQKEATRLNEINKQQLSLKPGSPERLALSAEWKAGAAALQPYIDMFAQVANKTPLTMSPTKASGPRSLFKAIGAKMHNLHEFYAQGLPAMLSEAIGNTPTFGVSPSTGTFTTGTGFTSKSAKAAITETQKTGALPTGTPPPATEDTQAPATDTQAPTNQTQPPEDLNAGIPPPPRLSRQQAYQMTKDAMEMAVAAHGMTPDGFRLYAMRSRLGNALAPAERKAVASKVQSIVSMATNARAELMAPYAAQLQAYQAKYAAPAAGSQDPALVRAAIEGKALEAAQGPIKDAYKARADYEAMSRNAFGAENLSIVNENTGATEPAFNKEMLGRISSTMQQAQARAKQDPEYAKLYQASAMKYQESVAKNDANGVWAAIQSLNPAPPALPTGTPPTAL